MSVCGYVQEKGPNTKQKHQVLLLTKQQMRQAVCFSTLKLKIQLQQQQNIFATMWRRILDQSDFTVGGAKQNSN